MMREVEKVQWIEPRCDGHWTHLHKAFDYARRLLEQWMELHHEHDCYLPTILHRHYPKTFSIRLQPNPPSCPALQRWFDCFG
ncbi:MAG: hypothetical protein II852_04855 [Bacteroidales bacterium]|nr:hypothetical protein [Bacteroidales bacterium]